MPKNQTAHAVTTQGVTQEGVTLKISQWLWITLLAIVLDQASKLLADNLLQYANPVEIMPMLNFTLLHNKGAAFSFLASQGGWQRWFFLILTSIVSLFIFFWLKKLKTHQTIQYIALALILGGALGNLIDRAIYGHVIDFIDVYYQQHHWPAFNIADSVITSGAILLIYDT
ncbi:Lipoprotein signal peptidase, partial [hydrothermal vent metagenome]